MTGTAVDLIWLAPALALLGFVLNGALALWRPTAKTAVSVIGVGVLAGAFAVAVAAVSAFAGLGAEAPVVFRYWSWMAAGPLQVDAALQVDQLSAVMLLVVTGVGSLIHLFSVGYMKEDPGYARYFAYLNLFIFFMLVLVLGANFPVMFVGWEGVGLCSYLLIGFWFNEKVNADAGKKAFIVNRIGDFGFLVAMFIIFWTTGSLDFGAVFARAPTLLTAGGSVVTAITLFLFLGCTGKSAQIPLYTWLPDAMQGPTPVSALIHAATMVTAGVYLVARCNILFALAPVSSAVVAGVGAVTALFAATIALKQWDIKRVLAYSTLSQLGYMFAALGVGAFGAAIFHLMTHGFFKGLLFLGSGSVIHAVHEEQDMRRMGGLAKKIPHTYRTMLIGSIAIAGIPPLAGFFSKDEILGEAWNRGFQWVWAIGIVVAVMTAFYMFRLIGMTFWGESRVDPAVEPHIHESPSVMTTPLWILAIPSVLLGIVLSWPGPPVGPIFGIQAKGLLASWLEPVFAQATDLLHHTESDFLILGIDGALLAASIAVAVIGMTTAWRLFGAELGSIRWRPNPERVRALTARFRFLYRASLNKWWFDDLNHLLFMVIGGRIAAFLWWFDRRVVDDTVNDIASTTVGAGSRLRRVQTGRVQNYALGIAVGLIVMAGSFLVLAGR
jgi:NADH-quinone oxidoreductase subunit L